mgnify:CR=1 FL=1
MGRKLFENHNKMKKYFRAKLGVLNYKLHIKKLYYPHDRTVISWLIIWQYHVYILEHSGKNNSIFLNKILQTLCLKQEMLISN